MLDFRRRGGERNRDNRTFVRGFNLGGMKFKIAELFSLTSGEISNSFIFLIARSRFIFITRDKSSFFSFESIASSRTNRDTFPSVSALIQKETIVNLESIYNRSRDELKEGAEVSLINAGSVKVGSIWRGGFSG